MNCNSVNQLNKKNRKMKRTTCLLMLIMCGILSCTSQKNVGNGVTNTDLSITDKEWIVVAFANEKIEQLTAEQFPTMKLSEGRITGYSSCNRMQGTYSMEKNKITFGAIAVTKMFCFDTKDIEEKYLKMLPEVKSWKCEDDKLYFLDENKQVIITFEAKATSNE